MTCPPDIAITLLKILEAGLLRARAAAWEGDAERSAREIDHLHNIPALLAEFTLERLSYYWDVERQDVMDSPGKAAVNSAAFEPLWQQLHGQLELLIAAGRAD